MNTNLKIQRQKPFNPFVSKTLKQCRVYGVKICLKMYRTKEKNNLGNLLPQQIYFEVRASDGGLQRCYNKEDAVRWYEQMIEFEKRQTEIKY